MVWVPAFSVLIDTFPGQYCFKTPSSWSSYMWLLSYVFINTSDYNHMFHHHNDRHHLNIDRSSVIIRFLVFSPGTLVVIIKIVIVDRVLMAACHLINAIYQHHQGSDCSLLKQQLADDNDHEEAPGSRWVPTKTRCIPGEIFLEKACGSQHCQSQSNENSFERTLRHKVTKGTKVPKVPRYQQGDQRIQQGDQRYQQGDQRIQQGDQRYQGSQGKPVEEDHHPLYFWIICLKPEEIDQIFKANNA